MQAFKSNTVNVARLDEIAEIVAGQSPSSDTYNDNGEGLPFFQGKADFGDLHPQARKWCNAPVKIAHPDDVLVSVRAPVGPSNIANGTCCIGRGLAAVRAKSHLALPKYIYWVIKHSEPTLAAMSTGTTFAAITRKDLAGLTVPLPPLDEQQRIVDILDRAASIQRLRQAADEKLKEIIPALFVDMFGDPASNPKGWEKSSLGDLINIRSSVRLPDLVKDAHTLCIGADAISSGDGRLLFKPTVASVMPKSGKYFFQTGDVLYSKIRPYLCKAWLADCVGYCSADIYAIECRESIVPLFLQYCLLSKDFTDYAVAQSSRASMPKVNREALSAYVLPLPPVALQQEFSARAERVLEIAKLSRAGSEYSDLSMASLSSRFFTDA